MNDTTTLMMLASAWSAYFVLHSLLASPALKRRFAGLRCYRLLYNLIALATLLPIAGLHTLYQGEMVIQWQGPWRWLALLMSLGAAACFLWTLRYYDLGEFSGWHKCRHGETSSAKARLVISPPHRYVRHPWYSCALALIWCRDLDLAQLISTALITAYFVIGSRLEEQRLLAEFGDSYREYLREVPGLIPLPWRGMSRERAERLMNQKGSDSD
jgi:protein-S-isoprenylcysteine O-methyltransferase Ste14